MGPTPGIETPVTLDGPDVLDGGDGVEGLVGDALRWVRQVRRVVGWFSGFGYVTVFIQELAIRHPHVQNGKISVTLRRFATLHWAHYGSPCNPSTLSRCPISLMS
jgi:hypothetical protein